MITKKASKTILTWSFLAFSLLAVLGCASPFFIPSLVPEAPSEPLETVIVKTAEAAFTQTAMAIPPTKMLRQRNAGCPPAWGRCWDEYCLMRSITVR